MPCFLLEIVYTFLSAAAAAAEALCRPVDRMRLRVAFRYRHSFFFTTVAMARTTERMRRRSTSPFRLNIPNRAAMG